MSDSVCIIIAYFGYWPAWINYFLCSCGYNSSFNWLIYTDCAQLDNVPANVKIKQISFNDYIALVSDKLALKFLAVSYYKLCDIKPMLGYIHQDEVEDYDYWGFGDIDVIYGDLSKYYQPLLSKYQCVSTHSTRISGHLCLLKNNQQMQEVFKKIPDWQDIVADPEHRAFDERHFSRLFIRYKNFPAWLRNGLLALHSHARYACLHEAYTTPNCRIPWMDGSYSFPEEWYWSRGQLSYSGDKPQQTPYLHFMYWKENWCKESIDQFAIKKLSQANWIVSKHGIRVASHV
ncbi:DUF6625 family protein [Spartinivicinus ruber]|uniref:DUF6625 family protein n=1 Tax=Spartinivicinus ruber TaxID=2683272 RepID=UPI0013D7A71F|nr:DUF6625 family protein [Spartinivicinus ruber]